MKIRNKLISALLTACFILSAFSSSLAVSAENTGDNQFPFADVTETDWFYEDVKFCYGADLMKGTSNDTFAPNEHLSRAMLVTMLYRMAGEPEAENGALVFTDVPQDSWYTKAVIWAFENEIVKGPWKSTFAPDEDVTRAELATFIYRYVASEDLRISLALDAPNFADKNSIPEYAALSVSALYRSEIIKGKDGNRFDPSACATRAEGAALLNRIVTLAPKQEYALLEKYGMTAEAYATIDESLTMRSARVSIFEVDRHSIGIRLISESKEYPDNITITGKALKHDRTVDLIFEQELKNYLFFTVKDNYIKADVGISEIDYFIMEYTITIGGESETYIGYVTIESIC